MSNIPVIDLILLILIALMTIRGYVKGFVEELFSWASKVLAIGAAVMLYSAGAAFIRTKTMQNVRIIPEILAFVIIFIAILIFLKMLEHVLKDVVSGAKLKGINKILGLIFGLIEGFVLTALILFALTIQPLFDASKIISDSIFAEILLPVIRIPLERRREILKTALLLLPGIHITV